MAGRCHILRCLLFSGLLVCGSTALTQPAPGGSARSVFSLFPIDASCVCVKTKSQTATVASREATIRGRVFQIFMDKATKHEIFRVDVGSPDVKWWNYGVATEGDFNGDGVQDYAWYGGDDTSDVEYVFLSSQGSHRRLDVYKTMEREWARRFPAGPRLQFHRDVGDSLTKESLHRSSGALTLQGVVTTIKGKSQQDHPLRVSESNFAFSK